MKKEKYFNDEGTMLNQLKTFKKICFKPHQTDLQLIKYSCEDCIEANSCIFYNATHSKEFEYYLNKIKTEYIIKEPSPIPENSTRACYKKIKVKDIINAEFKKWSKNKPNKICDECKLNEICKFKKNVLPYIFTQNIDKINTTEKEIKFKVPDKIEYDEDGVVINSYYHEKYASKEFKEQIIKTNKRYVTYKDKQYAYYNKIEKKSLNNNEFSKSEIKITDLHLSIILNYTVKERKSKNLFLTYIMSKLYLNDNIKFINVDDFTKWIKINHYPDSKKNTWETNLKILSDLYIIHLDKRNNYYFSSEESYCIESLNELKQKFPNIFKNSIKMSNGLHWLKINLNFLFGYARDKKTNLEYIIYEYLLSINQYISRKRINDIWGFSPELQRNIENDLKIKKIWKNINIGDEKKQVNNKYEVNEMLINRIFKKINKKIDLSENLKEDIKRIKNIENLNKII